MEVIILKKPDKKSKDKSFAFEQKIKRLSTLSREEVDDLKKSRWKSIARGFQRMVNPKEEQVFYQILMHLNNNRCKKLLANPDYILAFSQMCYYTDKFINPIEAWKRDSDYADKQFQSIVRHLFAKYEMPLFFDKAWFEELALHQIWYIDIAQGKNIRKCDRLPIALSKKMSFYFMNAPSRLSINDAFKWSQLMICGGDPYLADQILRCNLDSQVRMPRDFWESSIQFFSNNDRLPLEKIREVFDYLNMICQHQPDFSFQGRTVASLLRLSNEWHETFARNNERTEPVKPPVVYWDKSFVEDDYYHFRGGGRRTRYDIIELLNSEQLLKEGQKMRHCVGGYSDACRSRRTAIFSIRVGMKRLATIEVRLNEKKVVQAKAACNNEISITAHALLKKWAKVNELKIAEDL